MMWLHADMAVDMAEEANRWFPLETGGTFLGYRSEHGSAVVTELVAPGPGAYRSLHSFKPDQEWQQMEIAKMYERSGRRIVYLGDWHTHPNAADGTLSWRDRRCLKRIIKTPAARNKGPIMMVLFGRPAEWAASAWRASLTSRFGLYQTLDLVPLVIKKYA